MYLSFKKHFGQNFLVDQNIIYKIIHAISPKPNQNFVEIGPGDGAITNHIVPCCNSIKLIEIDKDLVNQLQQEFQHNSKVNVINNDILKVSFDALSIDKPIRVIGNLPYNISTPILFHCIKNISKIKDCNFMLQKEVAERICAKKNSKNYGRLSIMIQYYFKPIALFNIKAECFKPKPKVESTLIRLTPYQNPNQIINEKDFTIIVRNAFSARRKTIANAIINFLSKNDLAKCNIDHQLRPENLDLKDFIQISNYYSKHKG
jgi:16S rRNA (adenine1518-N6/adenine1519-N6)-dimethyltransferase